MLVQFERVLQLACFVLRCRQLLAHLELVCEARVERVDFADHALLVRRELLHLLGQLRLHGCQLSLQLVLILLAVAELLMQVVALPDGILHLLQGLRRARVEQVRPLALLLLQGLPGLLPGSAQLALEELDHLLELLLLPVGLLSEVVRDLRGVGVLRRLRLLVEVLLQVSLARLQLPHDALVLADLDVARLDAQLELLLDDLKVLLVQLGRHAVSLLHAQRQVLLVQGLQALDLPPALLFLRGFDRLDGFDRFLLEPGLQVGRIEPRLLQLAPVTVDLGFALLQHRVQRADLVLELLDLALCLHEGLPVALAAVKRLLTLLLLLPDLLAHLLGQVVGLRPVVAHLALQLGDKAVLLALGAGLYSLQLPEPVLLPPHILLPQALVVRLELLFHGEVRLHLCDHSLLVCVEAEPDQLVHELRARSVKRASFAFATGQHDLLELLVGALQVEVYLVGLDDLAESLSQRGHPVLGHVLELVNGLVPAALETGHVVGVPPWLRLMLRRRLLLMLLLVQLPLGCAWGLLARSLRPCTAFDLWLGYLHDLRKQLLASGLKRNRRGALAKELLRAAVVIKVGEALVTRLLVYKIAHVQEVLLGLRSGCLLVRVRDLRVRVGFDRVECKGAAVRLLLSGD